MGVGISIHALRGESDQMAHILAALMPEFQSTPSARRATRRRPEERLYRLHFNPRPPRGGRRGFNDFLLLVGDFNPRPPRGERLTGNVDLNHAYKFQSTPSARRATMFLDEFDHIIKISIHALREESDP